MHKGKKLTEIGFEIGGNGSLIYKIVGKKNLSTQQLNHVNKYFNQIKNDSNFLRELKGKAEMFLKSGEFNGSNRAVKLKKLIDNL